MKCISCQDSHQEHSEISSMKRQLKSSVLSTEFQFPVQKNGINSMRYTCPLLRPVLHQWALLLDYITGCLQWVW